LIWILLMILLVLGIVALAKYISSGRKHYTRATHDGGEPT